MKTEPQGDRTPHHDATRIHGAPHFRRFSFEQTLEDLEQAVRWIEGHGRSVDPTRIGRYRKDLRRAIEQLASGELKALFKSGDDAEKGKVFAAILTSQYEVGEFISIYNGLKTLAASVDQHKLRALLSGPISYLDEAPSSAAARNTAFELIVAARLGEIGLKPALVPPADILVPFRSTQLVVECKRPQNLGSVEGNIEDAFGQLRERYGTTPTPSLRGIAAIDVTKAVNPNFHRLRAASLADLDAQLGGALETFARKYGGSWLSKAPPGTIGVLLRISMIGELQDSQLPVYTQNYLFISLARPGSLDNEVTRELYGLMLRPPVWKRQGPRESLV